MVPRNTHLLSKNGCLRIALCGPLQYLFSRFPTEGHLECFPSPALNVIAHTRAYIFDKFLEVELLGQRLCEFVILLAITTVLLMPVVPTHNPQSNV